MKDAELAVLSKQGSREAFSVLAERWNVRLFRFLHRLLGDEELARDACQETLMKAWTNIDRLRQPEHFKAWIHQIALNLSRDRGRALGNRLHREVELDEKTVNDTPSDEESPFDKANSRGHFYLLTQVLAELPSDQRTAIVLREFEGFTSREIGTLQGVSAATVRSRIFYGLRALRGHLEERGITPDVFQQGAVS